MSKLFDCQVAELLQNPGKYNPEIRALSYAILQEKRRLMEKSRRTRTMAMIDDLAEEILDVLAVELRTPAYDEEFPVETKRALVKGTLAFYKILGTPEAVNWVVRSIFGSGEIEEWFRYGGEPHHFRVYAKNSHITQTDMEEFRRVLSTVKRRSSWMDEMIFESVAPELELHTGGIFGTITATKLPLAAGQGFVTQYPVGALADENGLLLMDEDGAILYE